MLLSFLIFFLAATSEAAIHRVCNGCSGTGYYSEVQPAINAAAVGDVIELQAGQSHYGSLSFPSYVVLPRKKRIYIVTSRWWELPGRGVRIDPARDKHLLATIKNNGDINPAYRQDPIVFPLQYYFDATFDSSADTFSTVSLNNGETIACAAAYRGGTMPSGLTEGGLYYIVGKSGSAASLALTPGGAPINFTTNGSSVRCQGVENSSDVTFIGIRFSPADYSADTLVSLSSGHEIHPAGRTANITFDHCVFCGVSNADCVLDVTNYYDGPKNLLIANTKGLIVRDSYFSQVHKMGDESHAMALFFSDGVLLENNYVAGGSMAILAGGLAAPTGGTQWHPQNMVLRRNVFTVADYMNWQSIAGAPTGACKTGGFRLNSSVAGSDCSPTGRCYVCEAGAWVNRTDATLRGNHENPKALVEWKEAWNILTEENEFYGGVAGADVGNPNTCFMLSRLETANPDLTTGEVIYRNNRCREGWKGVIADGLSRALFTGPTGPVTVDNNIFQDMVVWPSRTTEYASSASAYSLTFQLADACDTCQFTRTTTTMKSTDWLDRVIQFGHEWSSGTMPNFLYEGNIAPLAQIIVDGAANNCTGLQAFLTSSASVIKNFAWYGGSGSTSFAACLGSHNLPSSIDFVSSTNLRLAPGSTHAADCASGCGVKNPDGTDLGPDVDAIEAAVDGVMEGTRKPLDVKLTVGSTYAIAEYVSPVAADCIWTLSTAAARNVAANAHADTTFSGALDSRTGSTSRVEGKQTIRQFIFGGGTPLSVNTQHWAKGNCGGKLAVLQFRTLASASDRKISTVGASAAGNVCTDAAMSTGCTSIDAARDHKFTASGLVYYQRSGGPVRAYLGQ